MTSLLFIAALLAILTFPSVQSLEATEMNTVCKVPYAVRELATLLSKESLSVDDLFCSYWMKRYLNPDSPSKAPMVCLRAPEASAVLAADAAARDHFFKLGGERFYRRSLGRSPLSNPSTDVTENAYGSDLHGRSYYPPNWCEHYMQAMICQIAFPQVVGTAASDIRPVCHRSCLHMMRQCNRYAPMESELEATSAPFFIDPKKDTDLCKTPTALVNAAYCAYWNQGCGTLAGSLGSTVSSEKDHENCVEFDASLDFTL